MTMTTVAELVAAYQDGTLDRETELVLDNDGAFIYVGDQQAFDSHPHTVLREALTLLNIPWTEA